MQRIEHSSWSREVSLVLTKLIDSLLQDPISPNHWPQIFGPLNGDILSIRGWWQWVFELHIESKAHEALRQYTSLLKIHDPDLSLPINRKVLPINVGVVADGFVMAEINSLVLPAMPREDLKDL